MSWHFLQGGAVACWPQSSLDGAPSALLSLMPVQGESFLTVNEMESSINSQSGTTCELSMVSRGAAELTLLQADSPAKTLASAEQARDLAEQDQGFGWSRSGSFARLDRSSLSWRTRQCSLLEDLEPSLETWPNWGWMQDGECSELPALEQPITEKGFTWLLTPTAQSWKAWTFRNPLALIRKNHADGNLQEQLMRLYQRMTTPRCQEILMMWPEGWTDSKPLEMDGFQRWLREQSGRSSMREAA